MYFVNTRPTGEWKVLHDQAFSCSGGQERILIFDEQ